MGNDREKTQAPAGAAEFSRVGVRVLGEEHPNTLISIGNLGNSLDEQGRYAEAEALYRQTLEILRRVLGEEHPVTLRSLNQLADSLSKQGLYAEAEPLARRAAATGVGTDKATLTGTLGQVLTGLGRHSEAEPLLHEAFRLVPNKRFYWQKLAESLVALYDSRDAPGRRLTGR